MKQYVIDATTVEGREHYAFPCPNCGDSQRVERVVVYRSGTVEILLPKPKDYDPPLPEAAPRPAVRPLPERLAAIFAPAPKPARRKVEPKAKPAARKRRR
jgi:hypothetical protein